jgi:hypothetical protein
MVNKAVEDGFVGWIPKQWYRSTRDLVQEVRKRTAVMEDSDRAFPQRAAERAPNVCAFVTDVSIALEHGVTRVLAYFGQLTDKVQGALGVGKFHQGLPVKA